MNVLSRDQQIQVIACLTEGMSIRATERMTGIHRDTIMRLAARVGRGCAALHDRMFVGVELKESYWRQACRYMDAEDRQASLFDIEAVA